MKYIRKTLSTVQTGLCKLLGCGYLVPVKYGKAIRNNNSFSRHYHINDFTDLTFPQKQIQKFFDLADEQLVLEVNKDIEDDEDEYTGILLTVVVKSCNRNSLKNSFHEISFEESFNSYNKQLVISNIPVDLSDYKRNFELTCYLTGYTNEYTNEIDTARFGCSADLIFHYKFITLDEFFKQADKLNNNFKRSFRG